VGSIRQVSEILRVYIIAFMIFFIRYWSLLFIPHIFICLIFLIYTLVGASIIQEIESDDLHSTSSTTLETTPIPVISTKNLDRERERLLSKIIEKRQTLDVQQYTKFVNKQIREFEEELKNTHKSTITTPEKPSLNEENPRWTFAGSLYFIGTTLTTIGKHIKYFLYLLSLFVFQVQMNLHQ
jgi:hypothetical protein